MKRSISILLCLVLVFSSFSFSFAAVTDVSDATTHTRLQTIITWLQNTAPTFNQINTFSQIFSGTYTGSSFTNYTFKGVLGLITDRLYNINNNLVTIKNSLSDGSGNGIATILNNIYNEIVYTDAGQNVIHAFQFIAGRVNTINTNVTTLKNNQVTMNTNLSSILTEVSSSLPAIVQKATSIDTTTSNLYTLESNNLPGIKAYSEDIDLTVNTINDLQQLQLPKLEDLKRALTNYNPAFYNQELTAAQFQLYSHRNLINSGFPSTPWYILTTALDNGSQSTQSVNWFYGTPLGNIMVGLQRLNYNLVNTYQWEWAARTAGYNVAQSILNPVTLQSQNYSPTSEINGLYKYLNSLNTGIARLAFVHASDFEIAAREKAQNNETAVVNQFIDNTGAGSLPTSNISDVSSLSSGVKTNLQTNASPSQIWEIFNSDHGSWFSQETANQLDTTSNNRKGSSEFETPLLDNQIEEIYLSIGVKP